MLKQQILQFIAMGGFGVYVWSAFGFTLVILSGNLFWTLRRHRRLPAELKQKLKELAPIPPAPEIIEVGRVNQPEHIVS